jgi:hypothetical protein
MSVEVSHTWALCLSVARIFLCTATYYQTKTNQESFLSSAAFNTIRRSRVWTSIHIIIFWTYLLIASNNQPYLSIPYTHCCISFQRHTRTHYYIKGKSTTLHTYGKQRPWYWNAFGHWAPNGQAGENEKPKKAIRISNLLKSLSWWK